MRKFSRIVENKEFEGRGDLLDSVISMVEYIDFSSDEKKDFFHRYFFEEAPISDATLDRYSADLDNGNLRTIYNTDTKEMDYEFLRDYLYGLYEVNIDEISHVYLDALWAIYSIKKRMGHKFKQINTNKIK